MLELKMLESLRAACEKCYSLRAVGPYDERRGQRTNFRNGALELAKKTEQNEFNLYCRLNCEKARKSIGL